MIKRLLSLFKKKITCKHEYAIGDVDEYVRGVTLNWSGNPARLLDFKSTCNKCGAVKWKRSCVLPQAVEDHHRKYHPDDFDKDDGWPLNKNGERMRRAH